MLSSYPMSTELESLILGPRHQCFKNSPGDTNMCPSLRTRVPIPDSGRISRGWHRKLLRLTEAELDLKVLATPQHLRLPPRTPCHDLSLPLVCVETLAKEV